MMELFGLMVNGDGVAEAMFTQEAIGIGQDRAALMYEGRGSMETVAIDGIEVAGDNSLQWAVCSMQLR
jgi:hypothetical protein